MSYDPLNPGWTTVGQMRRRQTNGGAVNPNAALFKERDLLGISALARRDLASARKAAQDAGENPDAWFPTNPL